MDNYIRNSIRKEARACLKKRADGFFGGLVSLPGRVAEGVGEMGQALGTAAIPFLLAPPLLGATMASMKSKTEEPKQQDWELIRKQELLRLYKMFADDAEQKARQMTGAGD